MTAAKIDRRDLLALGGAAVALASGSPAAAVPTPARAGGVFFFEPSSPEARSAATAAHGQRLVAIDRDPVRLWRNRGDTPATPVAGATRWSDYLILRGLAEEAGLRLVREERHGATAGAMIVDWQMA